MESDQMNGQWAELPAELRSMVEDDEPVRRAYGGLQLCAVRDLFTGEVASDYWVVALANSGETLLVLLCGEARAIEIATHFAALKDWQHVADWDGRDLMPEQIEIITRYPGEAVPPIGYADDIDEWDDDVPYGPN